MARIGGSANDLVKLRRTMAVPMSAGGHGVGDIALLPRDAGV